MIRDLLAVVVVLSWHKRWIVIGATVFVTVLCGWFAATHLRMDADEAKLLAADLPFKQAEERLAKTFPGSFSDIVIVIDAPSPGQAQNASDQLLTRLLDQTDQFQGVRQQSGADFFRKNGLLYLPTSDLRTLSDHLTEAQPIIGTLARDPSARGLSTLISIFAEGIDRKETSLMDVLPVLGVINTLIDGSIKETPPRPFLPDGEASSIIPNRTFLMVKPVLDFSDLTPGQAATKAIRAAANDLNLTPAQGYQIHLTGPVVLSDDNFATVESGIGRTGVLSSIAVLVILVVAVRNWPLVGAIVATLVVGLTLTAAFAAATVGTLNPISVAFAVMFIGIAVDFAIQFVVRFLDIRLHAHDSKAAIIQTAKVMVAPLSLAAVASAAGFLSFLPTNYQGVSQLGLVAGGGMIIALVVDLTLLPALLRVIRPNGHEDMGGLPMAKAVDGALSKYAQIFAAIALALGLAGAVLSPKLRFDTNTLHLQNPKTESIATLMDLARTSETSPYFVDMLAKDEQSATDMVTRLGTLPQIDHAISLNTFVPDDQEDKLALIADINDIYGPILAPEAKLPPAEIAATQAALRQASMALGAAVPLGTPETTRLIHLLEEVATSDELVKRLDKRLDDQISPNISLLVSLLGASAVTAVDLPADLVAEWISADGLRKVTAWPRENMGDPAAMEDFVRAVQSVDPMASGMAVSMVEAGNVIVHSFAQAALLSLVAIALLLGLILRRFLDSILVLLPLLLGCLYTVLGCVLFGLPINFANIIALPLLLGIGVAFNIYFVVNWRAGIQNHWGTATGRAVLFSALTTSSAFGSLAVSPHVGTASMGLLLFMSVGFTVATTFFVLPALLHLMPKPE